MTWVPKEKDRLPVGDEGSDMMSRPSPLALSFMIVSFSGVISLSEKVSAIAAIKCEIKEDEKKIAI